MAVSALTYPAESPAIEVVPVTSARDRAAFLRLPYTLYRGQPAWRPPLRLERRMQLSEKSNKLMSHIAPQLFLARRAGRVVGRIAAFTNALHDEIHGGRDGFFGYFDTIDDGDVGRELLEAAKAHLRAIGRTRVYGPMQWSVNEEVGLLVDGFEHPNVILMPYGEPRYPVVLESNGFSKATDMLAFRAELVAEKRNTPIVRRLLRTSAREERLTYRDLDRNAFAADVEKAMAIYNDAWADNWNALPYTPEQVAALAGELKPLMFEGGFRFAELDGKPVAFGVVLPDLNEAIRDADGRLNPLTAWRAIRRLKGRQVRGARLPLMGLVRELHNTTLGLAAITQLCEDLFAASERQGFTHIEMSWILEDNIPMIRICEQAQGVPYKRYRMYEAAL